MSRTLDLLLVAVVAGLGWWLFFARGEAARAAEESAREAATLARAQAVEAVEQNAGGTDGVAAAGEALRWLVDDLDLARHPALTFVAQTDGETQIRALDAAIVPPLAEGDAVEVVCTDAGPGPLAVGVSVHVPGPEVLRWWHEVREEDERGLGGTMALAEVLQLVRFDVVDAGGEAVGGYTVRWPGTGDGAPWNDEARRLQPDAEGRYLLPRRAGVRLEICDDDGAAALVSDPVDGARVQLVE